MTSFTLELYYDKYATNCPGTATKYERSPLIERPECDIPTRIKIDNAKVPFCDGYTQMRNRLYQIIGENLGVF